MSQNRYLIMATALLMLSPLALRAGEAKTPPADTARIDTLIKELADDAFEKRQNAQKELERLGVSAEAALKAAVASKDAQVKATVEKLLAKIKLQKIGAINYLDVFPAASIMVLEFANPKKSAENIKTTALAKLWYSEALAPFRNKVIAAVNAAGEEKKKLDPWLNRFNGQLGAAFWGYMPPLMVKAAAVAEINDPDPKAVLEELMVLLNLTGEGGAPFNYKGVDIIEGANDQGAIALVGRHLVLGANLASVKEVVDGFLAPGNFSASPNYAQLKPALNPAPDMQVCFDFPSYVKTVTEILGLFMPQAAEALNDPDAKQLRMLSYTTATKNNAFEDHFIMGLDSDATVLYAGNMPPADAEPPLKTMSLVPANAVAAMVGFMSGKALKKDFDKSVEKLKKMAPPNAPNPLAELEELEKKLGIKFTDLALNLQGEVAYWAVLNQGLTPPDLGILLTCADADKAKLFSAGLVNIFNKLKDVPAIKEAAYRNRTIYQIDLAALGLAIPPAFPLAPCWTVDDKRIYIGSTTQMLQKQLVNIDNKAAGLLTQPEFIKAMGTLQEQERRGSIMYADVRSLLTLAASLGLPMLQTVADEEAQKALAALPAPSELFKDIPPLLGATYVQGKTLQTIIRGPVPPMPTLFALIVAAIGVSSKAGALPGKF